MKPTESSVLSIALVQGGASDIIEEPNSGFNYDKHETIYFWSNNSFIIIIMRKMKTNQNFFIMAHNQKVYKQ